MGDFLEGHQAELIETINRELDDWGLLGDVEDSEIKETNVTDVEVMELTSFGSTEERDSILVIGRLTVRADVSYSHPDWDNAIYDSEDKRHIPFEDLNGETEVSFDVDLMVCPVWPYFLHANIAKPDILQGSRSHALKGGDQRLRYLIRLLRAAT